MHPVTKLDILLQAACTPGSFVGVTQIAPTEWSVQWTDKATDADRAAAATALIGFDPATPDADLIKAECQRRIYAVANEKAQMNMLARQVLGQFTAEQANAYTAGVAWVEAMRAKCRQLIMSADKTYADDAHWPVCPNALAALAAQF